jgi:hypothetical protein
MTAPVTRAKAAASAGVLGPGPAESAGRCIRPPLGVPVVGLDIDGVLADYVGGLLRFVNTRLTTRYTPAEILCEGVGRSLPIAPDTYRALKREFRDSGLEGLGSEPIPGAVSFVRGLKTRGYYVCLITGRPCRAVPRLVPDTLAWLERHRVPFDACLFERRKPECLASLARTGQLAGFVEDSAEQAQRIAALGIAVWLRRTTYNTGVAVPGVRYFSDFETLSRAFQAGP